MCTFRTVLCVTVSLAVVSVAVLVQAMAAGTATPPSNQEQTKSSPGRLAEDTRLVTPGGAAFKAPAGWSVNSGKNMIILEPPETDTHIAIVDVQAVDAAAAVAAAWSTYKPDFKRPLRLATPQPPRDGWEEQKTFAYETSPNERVVVVAIAYRKGSAWTVAL